MRYWLSLAMLTLLSASGRAQDINEELEKAAKAAILKVAPSVVKIETAGGTETISSGPRGVVRKGVGPTTGVIVAADGYIISSAFNFANKPTDIFISIPGKGRLVAKVVANDTTRMLTLLKVDAKDLPVPVAVPTKQIDVGQWSLAVGRTLDPNVDHPPSMSTGIISAVGRIWGKAIQTDAKVSPVNYGGPLVAIDGRVQGILIPASHQSEGEAAGVEWYDSGIGFAIPFEDVLRVVPRLREGKNLIPGLLGITPQGSDQYSVVPTIGNVAPDSAAFRAGLKAGDVILSIDGKPVVNQAQVLHALRPKYEGDVVSVKVKRGDKEVDFPNITLTGSLTAVANPFIGILPMRDDPEPGVEIRYVYPKSPAAEAGLKVGDRLMKIAPSSAMQLAPFAGRDQLLNMLNTLAPNAEVKVEVKRKDGKTETLTFRLGALTEEAAAEIPLPSTKGKALEKPKPVGPVRPIPKKDEPKKDEPKKEEPKKDEPKKDEPKTGLIKRNNPTVNHDYWLFVPENYDPNIAHGLVIWLHPPGKGGKDADDMVDIWEKVCEDHHLIILAPKSGNDSWIASEAEQVLQDVAEVAQSYTIDKQRIIAHGMNVGGQMAFYMAFTARDTIRGVATTGSVLANQPKENIANQRLSFFIVAGDKDPIAKDIAESKPKLVEKKFPVLFREVKEMGKEYLDVPTFKELIRWVDSIDRL